MPDGGDLSAPSCGPGRPDICGIFDGSLEGFLSVIHEHYYRKMDFLYICEEAEYQQALDAEYVFVSTDYPKSRKVFEAVRNKISPRAESNVYHCYLSADKRKYMAMYDYLLLGFRVGADVDKHLQNDSVLLVHKLAGHVGKEAHLLKGFCRFRETAQGVYYASISPENNPLPILAEHFRERLMNQAWIIHDQSHGMAAVYDGKDYIISEVPVNIDIEQADRDENYQELWRAFFNTIAISERKNSKLQQRHIPLRYRKHMTEFIPVIKRQPKTAIENKTNGSE